MTFPWTFPETFGTARTASFSGNGALSAVVASHPPTSAGLHGRGQLSITISFAAHFSGHGALSINAPIAAHGGYSGHGQLSVSISLKVLAPAHLTGHGALSAAAGRKPPTPFHGNGQLSATAKLTKTRVAPTFAGNGAASATGVNQFLGAAIQFGHGRLTVTAVTAKVSATANFTGNGALITHDDAFFAVIGDWTPQGAVAADVTFYPKPATAGSPVNTKITEGVLRASLPVISGSYLAVFSNTTLDSTSGAINSFAFASPNQWQSVDLHASVSPPPMVAVGTMPPGAPISSALWSSAACWADQ